MPGHVCACPAGRHRAQFDNMSTTSPFPSRAIDNRNVTAHIIFGTIATKLYVMHFCTLLLPPRA
jgi:hypothetical protein